MLQCDVMCCRVLRCEDCPSDMIILGNWCVCVACCGVLRCVAVCCSVLQCVAVCCSGMYCVPLSCRVLQSVAVCCGVRIVLVQGGEDS